MKKCGTNKTSILFILTLFFFSNFVVAQQDKKYQGVGSVSEIIIPFSASIQHNFNLFYEIHQNKQENKIPSFWYKIVFNKACTFQFTLFPLYEEDGYNFYLFKINSNQDFCAAFAQEKIATFNAERLYKTYTDREQSEQFRANLVDIKPVAVKPGDAIYIEVFATKGKDRGHILDFRTSDNSFVVKVFNDEMIDFKDTIQTNVKYTPQPIANEKQALDKLGEVLCTLNKKSVYISSIQMKGGDVIVKQVADFHAKISDVKAIDKKDIAIIDSISKNNLVHENKNVIPDSVVKIKSTADLNSLEIINVPVSYASTSNSSKSQKNATRLEVDNVLFSLLQEDLKRKIKALYVQLKKQNESARKTKDKTQKLEMKNAIAAVDKQRTAFVIKSIDTKHKLKEINRLLREERKKKVTSEKSVFAKSMEIENVKTIEAAITKDTSAFQHVLPGGLIYKVQIGVYKNPVSPNLFKGLTPVFEESFAGGVRYSAGAFANFADAQLAKEYIKSMGLTDAFVIAYYKGQKISVTDAKIAESKK